MSSWRIKGRQELRAGNSFQVISISRFHPSFMRDLRWQHGQRAKTPIPWPRRNLRGVSPHMLSANNTIHLSRPFQFFFWHVLSFRPGDGKREQMLARKLDAMDLKTAEIFANANEMDLDILSYQKVEPRNHRRPPQESCLAIARWPWSICHMAIQAALATSSSGPDLGGAASILRLQATSVGQLRDAVRRCLPFSAFLALTKQLEGSQQHFTGVFGMPPRTVARREEARSLTPPQSDRV